MIKYLFYLSALALTAASAAFIDLNSPRYEPPPRTVSPTNRAYATGVIEGAAREIELRPEVVGRARLVLVQTGEVVTKNQVLVQLDDRTQRQLVAVSRSQLELTQAQLERLTNGARPSERAEAKALWDAKQVQLAQAKRTWERIRQLNEQAAISRQQADEQEAAVFGLAAEAAAAQARWERVNAPARTDELREAQARVAAAEAELALAELALEKCQLRAPCDGSVLDVRVEPGELLGPEAAAPAIVLADASRFRVRVYVEEIDAPRIAPGMLVEVTADGVPGTTWRGVVASLSPRMAPKQVFSGAANELYDAKVREALVDLEPESGLLLGLRVDVVIHMAGDAARPPQTDVAEVNVATTDGDR